MSSGIDQTWGAIAAYAKWAAVDFVPVGAEPLVGIYETEGWQAAPDGALRRGITKQTFSHGLFEALQSANPELYRTTRDALRADDRFGEWDGGMVGTAMSSSGFSVDQIVSSCVAAQITSDGEFLPDEAKVRATYDEIVQWFTSPHQKATALIPLPGLKVAAGGDSFELEPGIVFGRFSDEEFVTLARLDVISSGFGDFPLINEAYRFGCRIEIEMPTRFQTQADLQAEPAPTTPATRRFGQRTSWAFNDLVQDVLLATRLANSERIVAPGAIMQMPGWLGRGGTHFFRYPTSHFVMTQYVLDDATSIKMRTLWDELKAPTGKHHLPEIAVRRFNAAVDRPSLEDSLVDLMIVGEALFLSDQSKDRGELGYRLRQRAAKLLGGSGRPWREVQAVVGRAYDLRSRVVHGADLPLSVKVDGSKLEISAFIARLSEVVRECLVISVHEYATNKNFATAAYWDELIMGPDHTTEKTDPVA